MLKVSCERGEMIPVGRPESTTRGGVEGAVGWEVEKRQHMWWGGAWATWPVIPDAAWVYIGWDEEECGLGGGGVGQAEPASNGEVMHEQLDL